MSKEKLGKYTLIRQIAEGGMAQIWLAEQRGPGGFNKELVIKRILPHLAEEGDMTEMFFDEARIVAHLTHPNIGQVFELGEQDGDYFIAMEYIDGFDLLDLREAVDEREMTLPVAYAARIVCDVLQALDYAHNYVDRDGKHVGLIHRDISPHNVLISNDGVVKLVDFGVAKAAINTHKTETGAVKGKFAYMAPEQIEEEDLDHRVDIFAMGALFFELLTGEKPFGDDLKAVSKIIAEERPDPRTHRNDIPDEVAEIILKALATDREDRFGTAAEMERAIETYLKEFDEVVGTRELSVMVHQLRGLEVQKPTEQMYGFQKHGVDKQEPRITVNESDDGPGDRVTAEIEEADTAERVVDAESSQVATGQQYAAESGQKAKRQPTRTKKKTKEETPSSRGASPQDETSPSVAASPQPPEPRRASAGLVVLFLAGMAGLLGAFGIGSYLVIANAEVPEVEAAVIDESPQWRHGDGALIVYIDADEPADVIRDGEVVGRTPYHTYLRPGDYSAQLRTDGGASTEIELAVTDEQPIQRFRFEL